MSRRMAMVVILVDILSVALMLIRGAIAITLGSALTSFANSLPGH